MGVMFKRGGGVKARPVLVDLHQPGRLRVAHLLTLLGLSASEFYRQRKAGKIPPPDGHDGRCPYWNTATARTLLDGGGHERAK
jgi:hypothetical protein